MKRMLDHTKRVIKVTAVLIVVLASTVFYLGEQAYIGLFVLVLVAIVALAIVGTLDLVNLFRTDPVDPPNWLVLADAAGYISKSVGILLLLFIVVRPYLAVFGVVIEPFPPGVSRHLLAMTIVLICIPMAARSVLMRLARLKPRRNRRHDDPQETLA